MKVEDYLRNTESDKIGYFAFTVRKLQSQTKQSLELWNKFNLDEDDLPYFRTLHSTT